MRVFVRIMDFFVVRIADYHGLEICNIRAFPKGSFCFTAMPTRRLTLSPGPLVPEHHISAQNP